MNKRKRNHDHAPRVGFGYDIHRFAPQRKLILGGVHIPYVLGLLGHSDADVLLHSICDALLGAAALGDIGKHFPTGDKRFKNISSLKLLLQVGKLIKQHHYEIINIDSTVILQEPKISPYVSTMQKKIAQFLHIEKSQISIKATTNEELGNLGHARGCAAFAVAYINPIDQP